MSAVRALAGAFSRLTSASSAAASSMSIPHAMTQVRTGITVPVQGGNVDKALRQLNRRLSESGINQAWKSKAYHIPPTVKRKLQAKETAKRISRERFNEKLRWILQRKERGF